jgi:hypothetical protein
MRAAAALGFLLALGIWVGHAFAAVSGPTQLPTTSLPITTVVPSLPTTVPKLPTTTTVPAPPKLPTTTTVPAPPKLPTTTTVPAPPRTPSPTTTTSSAPQIVSTATTATGAPTGQSVPSTVRTAGSSGSYAGLGAGHSGAQTSQGPGGAGGSGGQASPANPNPQAQGLRSSRPYVTKSGPKRKQRIILSFVLSQGGRVYFLVKQVSPDCRVAGRFSVRGLKGVNRVPFKGKVGGKPLDPGTYLISATTRRSERILRTTVIVFKRGTPTRAALRAALAANVCPPPSLLAASSGSFVGSFGTAELTAPAKQGIDIDIPSPGSAVGDSPSKSPGGVLGGAVERIAAEAIKPLAVILLGIAILLLGLAALPKAAVPDPRLNDVLARHRPEIAAAGAAAMVTGIIYFLIS